MSGEWKNERKIEVNPSWIIQALIGLIIAIGGWSVTKTLDVIEADIAEIKAEQRQNAIDRQQLRADMSALELGLRGNRFTQQDWERESGKIERQLADIVDRLRELEAQ